MHTQVICRNQFKCTKKVLDFWNYYKTFLYMSLRAFQNLWKYLIFSTSKRLQLTQVSTNKRFSNTWRLESELCKVRLFLVRRFIIFSYDCWKVIRGNKINKIASASIILILTPYVELLLIEYFNFLTCVSLFNSKSIRTCKRKTIRSWVPWRSTCQRL